MGNLDLLVKMYSKCFFLQRAGLELMDMMAVYQEGAYERLCRWSILMKKLVMYEMLIAYPVALNFSLSIAITTHLIFIMVFLSDVNKVLAIQ